MEFFEDLKIVDFDDSQVQESLRRPSFKRLALVLSSAPPPGWALLLQARYHSMWAVDKRIEVVGRILWVDCEPEDLQAVLDALKPMVAQTNTEVRANMTRLKREQVTRDGVAMADKERLARIKKNLKFD
jgi:hypothetical protein